MRIVFRDSAITGRKLSSSRGRNCLHWRCLRSLVLVLWGAAFGCSAGDLPPPDLQPSAKSLPDQEAWQWSTVVTREGKRRAVVSAGHFRRHDRLRKAELDDGVRVVFYNAAGNEAVSELTAQQAEIDEKTWDMRVSGEVLLMAEDGTRLETDALCWHREGEKITGEDRVTIRRAEGMETGVGFEASSDLRHWTLRKVTTHLGDAHSQQP